MIFVLLGCFRRFQNIPFARKMWRWMDISHAHPRPISNKLLLITRILFQITVLGQLVMWDGKEGRMLVCLGRFGPPCLEEIAKTNVGGAAKAFENKLMSPLFV